ncbi:MAG TPA: cupin domain-containing protein [Thermoanaerobaculia bacterium]|jgi:predicted cupin superfamily sugar epimerase|nr:cupin domain-containing protein [Thermoanaerobaculia bacterium]
MKIPPRAQHLIDSLGLAPHPEGGWYRQLYKSEDRVLREIDGERRNALTTIYFLLVEGTYSAWHRVKSDEAWHFYEGDPLELLYRANEEDPPQIATLDSDNRVHVIRAREWQAARPLGEYTLVGCTVGPGFEFDDFEMRPGPIQ